MPWLTTWRCRACRSVGVGQGIDEIIRHHERRPFEVFEVQVHVLLAGRQAALLAAARPAMAFAPVADAADVHIPHPRLAIVARGEGPEKAVELRQEDGIVIDRFPRSVRTGRLAHPVVTALGPRLHDPARSRDTAVPDGPYWSRCN